MTPVPTIERDIRHGGINWVVTRAAWPDDPAPYHWAAYIDRKTDGTATRIAGHAHTQDEAEEFVQRALKGEIR